MGGLVVPRGSLLEVFSEQERELICPSLDRAHLGRARKDRVPAMRDFISGIFDMHRSSPRLLGNAPLRQALKGAVLSNLAELLIDDSTVGEPWIRPSKRWKVVAVAREVALSRPEIPTGIAEICQAVGVSRRTLQYCFQDVLSINPVAFLRAVRLNGVRRMLKTAPSVTDAAAYWGFWHFGHFARDYRKMFGELPSEAYRRFHQKGGRA